MWILLLLTEGLFTSVAIEHTEDGVLLVGERRFRNGGVLHVNPPA